MSRRRTDRPRLWGCLLLLAAGACVAREPGESSDPSWPVYTDDYGTGAGGSGSSGQGGAAGQSGVVGGYRVTVRAAQTILCPGQCTELSAEAEHGNPPYAYAWGNGLGPGPGPHRVCPDQSTTYGVTASDTAVATEELGRPSQSTSGSVALEVVQDGRCALDGGLPSEQPQAREQCSIAIPYEDESGYPVLTTWGEGQSMATDVDGNLYLAGTYTAAIDLGDGFNEVETTASVFIAKFSSSCQLLWRRHFTVQPHSVRFNTVAVSPSGDQVVAAGWLLGTVAFDEHIASTGPGVEGFVSTLLVAFDPSDGHAIWARTGDGDGEPNGLYNLTFDGAGDMVVDGWVGSNATIAGVPLNNQRAGALIAKLSSNGELVFGRVFEGSETYMVSAVRPSGEIAVTSLSREPTVTYGGATIVDDVWHRYVAMLDSQGALLHSFDLDSDMLGTITEIGLHNLHFDRSGHVLVGHGDYVGSSGVAMPERISKLDAQANVLWTRDVSPPGFQEGPFAQGKFELDSLDNIIHTDLIDNIEDDGSDAGIRAQSKEPSDVIVQKLDPSGELIWRHVFDTDVFERAWGLVIGRDDSIWVGHGEDNDADPWRGTLRITKLAP